MMRQDIMMMRDEAAAWVARMDAGRWGGDDEIELRAWLHADERRQGVLLQMQAMWVAMDGLQPIGNHDESKNSGVSRRMLLAGGGTALAASFAGALVWVGSPVRYSTDIGEIRRVTLKDGTIAAINTTSQIDVKLAQSRRSIQIAEGEAWFQVAKDPKRPLTVSAGRVRARAVGTAFSVRRRANGAEILVTEGLVEAWPDAAEGVRVKLAAGEGAFIGDNARVVRITKAAVERALAWRFGNIDLVGQSLAEAAAEFNRYNKRKIIIIDPVVGSELLDGTFQFNDPEGFALAISESLSVPVDLASPSQIIIGKNSAMTGENPEGYFRAGSLFS